MGGILTSKAHEHDADDPVTNISWSDAIVWCNALTEYLNEHFGMKLDFAYYSDAGFQARPERRR